MSRSALLLVLAACQSDYKLSNEPSSGEGDDSAVPGDNDTGPEATDEDCDLDAPLGYSDEPNELCENEVAVGSFTPVVEYHKATWSTDSTSSSIMMTPVVGSLDDDNGDGLINEDDTPDIVVVTYGSYGTLRAVSGDGAYELFSVSNQQLQGQGAVALGDIDNDGIQEIIALTATTVKAFENDGTLKWTSPSIAGSIYGTSDAPAIADMDGDGKVEIIAGSAILNGMTGTIRGLGSYGRGGTMNVGTTSFAADIDADGVQEVVTGNALYTPDGATIWYNGQTDGYVAAADFDQDGQGEIVVMYAGTLRLQDTDGSVLWTTTIDNAGSYYGGPPTVADFDGDGEPEIGVAGASNYTVFDGDGTKLWVRSTQDGSSGNTGSAVFDFEGDGVAEVVYADETRLWVFSGPDGAVKLESTDHSNGTWLEYPIIADVDGDGQAEIVVAHTSGRTGFSVFGDLDESWRPGRKIWNQHAYSITNVNDDGTIPRNPEPNWLSYNNFRSGDMDAGDGLKAPDLTVDFGDICEIDCDEDRLLLWVHPGNLGASDLTSGAELVVTAGIGGTPVEVARIAISEVLTVGDFLEGVEIELNEPDMDTWNAIRVRVESGDLECDDDNNLLEIDGPFCQ
ncbi:MAG: hypothetical protein ACI8RZ_007871 [Myxococcota bacterium]|jgi:hypothetical protein